MIENSSLRLDNIADRDQREIRPVDLAGRGIDGPWTGRAITRSQNVRAEDAIAVDVEAAISVKKLGPPIGHFGGAGEGVTNQNSVVARGVEFAVHGVLNRYGAKFATAFQGEAFLFRKRVFRPDRRSDDHGPESTSTLEHFSRWCRVRSQFPVQPIANGSGHLVVPALGDKPVAFCNPWVRSATMSRMSSMPTDKRTSSGVTPVSFCSSGESCWWVVELG